MIIARFADISHFQKPAAQVDWSAYVGWSRQGDGTARLVFKATEGTGYTDNNMQGYWDAGLANNIPVLVPYHYARPDLHPGESGAAQEAAWFAKIVDALDLRKNDRVMLDLEQNESSAWAKAFAKNLPVYLGKPVLYDSLSHIKQFFTDPELPGLFDLAIAAYHPLEQGPPAVPAPWKAALWWQYSSTESVPGFGTCDANIWLGGASVPPTDYKAQQAADVWKSQVTPICPDTTGIHAAWLSAYEKGIPLGMPLDLEFKTVDWAGSPIVRQEFSQGWIEYYVQAAPGHPAGSNHGYCLSGPTVVSLW